MPLLREATVESTSEVWSSLRAQGFQPQQTVCTASLWNCTHTDKYFGKYFMAPVHKINGLGLREVF